MTRISNILIPVDFSDASRKAMHYATHLAMRFSAKLTVAHIIPSLGAFNYPYPNDPREFEKKAFVETRRLLPEEIPEAYRELLNSQTIVKCGDVRDELLHIVTEESVDLIVMGTHGRRNLERFFLEPREWAGITAPLTVDEANRPVPPGEFGTKLFVTVLFSRTQPLRAPWSSRKLFHLPCALNAWRHSQSQQRARRFSSEHIHAPDPRTQRSSVQFLSGWVASDLILRRRKFPQINIPTIQSTAAHATWL